MIVIVMGVTGTGKTTVGKRLAEALKWDFSDADSFHPQANIEKMRRGIPLDEGDRMPWLMALQQAIDGWLQSDKNVVLACSALKAAYRQALWRDAEQMRLVYLKGSFEQIAGRLQERQQHFMNKNLLQSQFDILEEPTPNESIWVDISQPLEAIVQQIVRRL
jgi:gluconokinase